MIRFVAENFNKEGTEFVPVEPSDWTENPNFIGNINDEGFRALAAAMNQIWKHLMRKIGGSQVSGDNCSNLEYQKTTFLLAGRVGGPQLAGVAGASLHSAGRQVQGGLLLGHPVDGERAPALRHGQHHQGDGGELQTPHWTVQHDTQW